MRIAVWVIAGAVVALTIPHAAYSETHTGDRTASAAREFVFDRQDGAHVEAGYERWQLTGHVQTAQGEHFSYQLTFSRSSSAARAHGDRADAGWHSATIYPAELAITDDDNREFSSSERLGRPVLGIAGASADRLAVHVDAWRMSVESGGAHRDRLTAIASEAHIGIALSQIAIEPRVANGENGVFMRGPCTRCTGTDLSYPRLRTSGTIVFHDKTFTVTGTSWLDHAYGNRESTADQAGWQRFDLQLDDGREVMCFMIRRRNGDIDEHSSATLIDRNGRATPLSSAQFSAKDYGGQTWKSPHSPASYPVLWKISIPSAGLLFSVASLTADQEIVPTAGGLPYWNGSVILQDENSGGTQIGAGFVELTGYTAPVSL